MHSADAPLLLTGAEYEGNGPRLQLACSPPPLPPCLPSLSPPPCHPSSTHRHGRIAGSPDRHLTTQAYHRHYYGLGEHYNALVPAD